MDVLLQARKRAEAAVSDMPDPDLRTAAFQVILKHLLDQLFTSATPDIASAPRPHGPAQARQSADTQQQASNLPRSVGTRILVLRDQGFFEGGRGIGEIRDELQARGWMYDLTAISGPLMKLVRRRHLRRVQSTNGKRKTFRYFNP